VATAPDDTLVAPLAETPDDVADNAQLCASGFTFHPPEFIALPTSSSNPTTPAMM